MKLTPIYPAHIKPVRVGVYKVSQDDDEPFFYSHWNGKWWGFYDFTPLKAFQQRTNMSENQNKRWQGVDKT